MEPLKNPQGLKSAPHHSFIIHLASWYPTQLKPYLGIFVKRHIKAVAPFRKCVLIHAYSDPEKDFSFRHAFQTDVDPNFTEYFLCYGRPKSAFEKLKRLWLVNQFYFKTIRDIITQKGRPSGFHLHVCWPLGMYIWPTLLKWKIPVLITEHWTGYLPEDGRYKGFFTKLITRLLIRKAKAMLVVSEKQKNAMLNHQLKGDYYLIDNVVDEAFEKRYQTEPEKSNKINFFHVSTLMEEEKNISGLLKGFGEALLQNPNLSLTIAGFESNWNLLMEKNPDFKKLPINYLGSLQAEQIAQEMQKADAFVLTSWFENQPVVCIEAWCSGLPLVAVPVGNLYLTMQRHNSVTIKSQKPEDITHAMLIFAEKKNQFDKKSIADEALAIYSSQIAGQKIEQIYQKYF